MRINKDILWDSSIENIYDILNAVKRKEVLKDIFFICIDKKGVMQILSCRQIYKDINSPKELKAIAAAKGKTSAFEMLARIYSDYSKKHGSIEGINEYCNY
ncbi:MAG: hypothetical protein IJR45_02660 [Firmicutes bacterium]|nr:hypothetical protein [Bacillota bacterium]MBQ9604292.1 hypothetical protein [Bacillota bacterium]